MRQRIMVIAMVALLLIGIASFAGAAPQISLGSLNLTKGQNGTVTLNLSGGTEKYAGVNATFDLPVGVSLVSVSKGNLPSAIFLLDSYKSLVNGKERVAVITYSGTNIFTAQSGTLLNIAVQATANAPLGNQSVTFVSSGLSNEDGSKSVAHAKTNGTITIEGCSYSIVPDQQIFGPTAGTGSIAVRSQTGCPWNASSNVPWITITSASSGSGGGAVNYAVSTNTFSSQRTGTQRTGTVTVAGKTVTITQLSTESQRQPTPVTVSGRKVLVNGTPFTVRGVGYSPVPVGEDPEFGPLYGDYFTASQSGTYDRDLPLLRNMGANAVRLWNWGTTADHLDFLDKAYNDGVDPIYVVAGFWINGGKDIDPNSQHNVRAKIKADFKQMVALHKNHPAILMWVIGNELNAPWMYGGKLVHLFSLINEMAAEAHAEEGANRHPVATALMDSNLINTIAVYNASVPSLDVWGANVFRGKTFGSLFSDYEAVSGKPLIILEYGIDAYDNKKGNEYEKTGPPLQADYAEALWKEIEARGDVCIGGSLMAYSDEWWKGKNGTGTGCPDNNPSFHSVCGYAIPSHPDGFSNEEWWGIMRTTDNPAGPDTMEPRAVYYRLQSLWIPSNVPTLGMLMPSLVMSAVGETQAFSAVYNDADGYANLKTVEFLVSQSGSGVNAIQVRYDRNLNRLDLLDDAMTGFVGSGCTPGKAGILENTQGTLNCQQTMVMGSGDDLTVILSITPKAPFASQMPKGLYMRAMDNSDASVGFLRKGTWTINP